MRSQYTEEKINPQLLSINIHFPVSFTSLWFLVNTRWIRQQINKLCGQPSQEEQPDRVVSPSCTDQRIRPNIALIVQNSATLRSFSSSRFPEHQEWLYMVSTLQLKASLIRMKLSMWAPSQINVKEIVKDNGKNLCLTCYCCIRAVLSYRVMAPVSLRGQERSACCRA